MVFARLSAENRHSAAHPHAVSVEPQTADGNLPGGGTAWGAGPLPLHHTVLQGSRRLQLRRTDCQRLATFRNI